MKSSLEAPEKQIAAETSANPEKAAPASVIDTSKMSTGQREALELAEASRDPLDDRGSFASNLFIGRYDFDRIFPWPEQSEEDRAAGAEFLQKLENYLREHVDADEIDRTGEIPPENFKGLAEIGAFGIKIPKKYGGGRVDGQNDAPTRGWGGGGGSAGGGGFWWEGGTGMLRPLAPRTSRSVSRSLCCCLAPKSKNRTTCRAWRPGRFPRSR